MAVAHRLAVQVRSTQQEREEEFLAKRQFSSMNLIEINVSNDLMASLNSAAILASMLFARYREVNVLLE